MPRQPGVFYDRRAGCWATNALGEMRRTTTDRGYRPRSYFRDLIHPTKDKRPANDRLSDRLRDEAAKLRPVGEPTLDQVSEWYLEAAENDLGSETYDRRLEQINRVLEWPDPRNPQRLGAIVARELTRDDVRPFLAAMIAAGCSESYVSDGLLKALKRMVSWACDVPVGEYPGLPIAANPLARMAGPTVLRRSHRPVNAITVSRFIRFVWRRALGDAGLTRRFGMIAAIMLWALHQTGARPKELCAAEWSELKVRPDGWAVLTLPAWKHKTGRKTGKARLIALPPMIVRRILWIASLKGRHETFIFTHRRGRGRGDLGTAEAGEPWVRVDREAKRVGDSKAHQKYVYRLVQEARVAGVDLPMGFRRYWMRSRYSTDAQRRGVPRSLLAEAMGTSEAMLERNYTDLDEADVLDVARRAFGGEPPG